MDKAIAPSLGVREVALALSAVLLVGVGALQAPQVEARAAATSTAASVVAPPTPVELATTKPTPAPPLADRVVPLGPPMPPFALAPPTPPPAPAPAPPPQPAARYLPGGTGLWLHE